MDDEFAHAYKEYRAFLKDNDLYDHTPALIEISRGIKSIISEIFQSWARWPQEIIVFIFTDSLTSRCFGKDEEVLHHNGNKKIDQMLHPDFL